MENLSATEDKATISALEKALEDEEGGSLTNADLEALKNLTDSDITTAFKNLPADL
jgi:hypothetical protein